MNACLSACMYNGQIYKLTWPHIWSGTKSICDGVWFNSFPANRGISGRRSTNSVRGMASKNRMHNVGEPAGIELRLACTRGNSCWLDGRFTYCDRYASSRSRYVVLCVIEFPFFDQHKISQQFIDFLLFHSDRYILFVFPSSTIRTAPAAAPAAGMCGTTTCQSAFDSLFLNIPMHFLSLSYESVCPFLMLRLQCDQVWVALFLSLTGHCAECLSFLPRFWSHLSTSCAFDAFLLSLDQFGRVVVSSVASPGKHHLLSVTFSPFLHHSICWKFPWL